MVAFEKDPSPKAPSPPAGGRGQGGGGSAAADRVNHPLTPTLSPKGARGKADGGSGEIAPALELRGVRRVFKSGGAEIVVLDGIDLALQPGEIVALVGPSGAGKSTLLHVAGLLERPDGGAVVIGGEDCGGLSDERRTLLRRSESGLCLPVPPSAAGVLGARKRHAAADDRRHAARPGAREGDRVAGRGRSRFQGRASAGTALGGRAAARRDRPRARQRPEASARRRADRQSRPRHRRRGHEHARSSLSAAPGLRPWSPPTTSTSPAASTASSPSKTGSCGGSTDNRPSAAVMCVNKPRIARFDERWAFLILWFHYSISAI